MVEPRNDGAHIPAAHQLIDLWQSARFEHLRQLPPLLRAIRTQQCSAEQTIGRKERQRVQSTQSNP